jgi:MFS family permease
MAAGSYFTGKVLHSQQRGRIAALWTPLAIFPLLAVGLTSNITLIGLALFVSGFAAGPVFVSSETAVQEHTPHRRQATVFALRDMLMKLAVVVAAALAAASADLIGTRTALLILIPAWLLLSLTQFARGQSSKIDSICPGSELES